MGVSKVLVIGESCVDRYIMGTVSRICPEAPVLILNQTEIVETGGMAHNVRNNLTVLGNAVSLITNSNPIIKQRFVDQGTNHMLLRVDVDDVAENINSSYIDDINVGAREFSAIVISDYNKGFLTPKQIEHICKAHPMVFVDTKKEIGDWAKSAFCIKINALEYKNNKKYIDNNLADRTIITLGEKGCQYRGESFKPIEKIEVRDTSGAGDTFLAGLVTEYLRTQDMRQAIEFANSCAGKVVSKFGVQTV